MASPQDVKVANFPSDTSVARCALDLARTINNSSSTKAPSGQDFRSYYLDLVAECVEALSGKRYISG